MHRDELPRGDAAGIVGTGDRQARRVVSALIERGNGDVADHDELLPALAKDDNRKVVVSTDAIIVAEVQLCRGDEGYFSARAWELRAAFDIAARLANQGRIDAACRILQPTAEKQPKEGGS